MILNLLIKIGLSGALGALVGVEREYSKKQHLFGTRTFLLVSLLGMLSAELSVFDISLTYFPIVSFISILLISYYFFKISSKTHTGGLTTLVLFPLVFIIGIFVSYYFYLEAVALAVIITAVLYAKRYSTDLVQKLTDEEWSDIIRFAIILFVFYPISPPFLTYYGLTFNIDMFFKMIYFVSAISFLAFLLYRLYPKLPLYIMGFLGGLINSTSLVYILAERAVQLKKSLFKAYSSAITASSLRNLLFISLISLPIFEVVWPFFAILILMHLAVQYFIPSRTIKLAALKMKHPFTLTKGIEFATVFLVISALLDYVISTSNIGFYIISFVGGIFSSIATIASILSLPNANSTAVSLAIISSLLGTLTANAVIGYMCRQRRMRLAMALSLFLSILGIGALAIYLFIV